LVTTVAVGYIYITCTERVMSAGMREVLDLLLSSLGGCGFDSHRGMNK